MEADEALRVAVTVVTGCVTVCMFVTVTTVTEGVDRVRKDEKVLAGVVTLKVDRNVCDTVTVTVEDADDTDVDSEDAEDDGDPDEEPEAVADAVACPENGMAEPVTRVGLAMFAISDEMAALFKSCPTMKLLVTTWLGAPTVMSTSIQVVYISCLP